MFTRRSNNGDDEAEVKRSRQPRGRKARLLFELRSELEEARQQLQEQDRRIREIAGDLAAQQSDHATFANRIVEMQTSHEEEVTHIRAARKQELSRLKVSIDKHKSEVTALKRELDFHDQPGHHEHAPPG